MIVLKIGLLVLGVYAGIVGGMYFLQRSLMYFPSQDLGTPAANGVPELEVVRLRTDDGLDLVAWYKPPAEADGVVVVYFHGNGGHIGHRAAKTRGFTRAGHGLLLVSYRGYGGNPGKPTEAGLFADARAAYAFLSEKGVAPGRIAIVGESLGSGAAVYLATEREIGALMLEAPFTSAGDVGQRAYPILPVKLLIKDPFDSLSRIGRVTAPLLVVHGERDEVVPVALGRHLFEAAGEPKEGIFPATARHNDLEEHGVTKMELDFLERYLGD
jgi:fermentation-respiration switch protein FrsA (DUF1100 family)